MKTNLGSPEGPVPFHFPSQVIICILTDVALWPPEYSKCGFFSHMEEKDCIRKCCRKVFDFLKRKTLCVFLVKKAPTAEKV